MVGIVNGNLQLGCYQGHSFQYAAICCEKLLAIAIADPVIAGDMTHEFCIPHVMAGISCQVNMFASCIFFSNNL